MARTVAVVEYLQHTAPQGQHGFSAHDLSCGYSIVAENDVRLAPFRVPAGIPESDTVSKLFASFSSLFGTFTRLNREKSINEMKTANKERNVRWFEPGETVFRRMPKGSRPPKHLFLMPSRGPYTVESQPDRFNLILRDPETGELVDKGRKIPFDQILAGPRRARLRFAEGHEIDPSDADVRPMSTLLQSDRNSAGTYKGAYLASRRKAGAL